MRALKQRVLAMQARAEAREPDRGPSHLIVMPDAWPAEDCRAYDDLYDRGEYAAWVRPARTTHWQTTWRLYPGDRATATR